MFFSSPTPNRPCRMTKYESNPSAQLISSVSVAEAMSVGSHRLSRVSVKQKTTSCSAISFSSVATSRKTFSVSFGDTGCPGIGMDISTPVALTEGNIRARASAAAVALGLPPARQSLNSNKLCRTGLEKLTFPLSTNVNSRTPQPSKHRATLQPSVPAPISKHLVLLIFARSSSGSNLHRMSFRFSSAAATASRVGSMLSPRSALRGPARPFGLSSHPTAGNGLFSGSNLCNSPPTAIVGSVT
mmetsp:Transcript_566/g.2190  ORF Transcript_566/g.2190 Transcript_566/m.2190 type:complete len:243 (-) Transcript_566:998-1726(-)